MDAPLVSIPGGTRWVKVTNPHPGQVIKVRKTNDLSVFYTQEKPGQSQGRVNGQHKSDRASFLRDYEPWSAKDWALAQTVMATVEQPVELNGQTVDDALQLVVLADAAEAVDAAHNGQPIDDSAVLEAEPVSEIPDENATAALLSPETSEADGQVEDEASKPVPRRVKPAEISEVEQEEIVELWRADQTVDEIARTYNAVSQTVYNVIATRVPEEYRLWRVVEQLKRNAGPIEAYRISQWMHLGKADVEALCTSDEAQKVLRYYVDVRDESKPWIKTPMVELLPMPIVIDITPTPTEAPAELPSPSQPEHPSESEPEMATKSPTNNAPTIDAELERIVASEPALQEIVEVTPTVTPTVAPRGRRWTVLVLTRVTASVEADSLIAAYTAAMEKYPDALEVVGVVEER
ncbi:MAG TPA: hypothetical protein VF821_02965 [Lentzea sp.]